MNVIALKDLTNIWKGKANKKLGKWGLAKLQSIIEYKADAIGKKLIAIDPRCASHICAQCARIRNIAMMRLYKCKSCGF